MSDESDVEADLIDDQQVDIQALVNQRDVAVQVSVNQLDEAVQILENQLANQFLVNNNSNDPLIIYNMSNPHQQIHVPLEYICACSSEYLIPNLPSYQLFFCCGTNCHYYRMIVTCLNIDQLEALFNLIHSEEFYCNLCSHTDDSPDR